MPNQDQNWDLDHVGEAIQSIIDKAISSQDYQKLNKTVADTVNHAIESGTSAVNRMRTAAKQQQRTPQYTVPRSSATRKRAADQTNKNLFLLYKEPTKGVLGGVFKCLGGGLLSLIAVPWLLGAGLSSLVTGLSIPFFTLLSILAAAVGGPALIVSGVKSLTRMNRYDRYVNAMGGKTYCEIRRLAQAVRKPMPFVVAELNKLIRQGYFIEGHMDADQQNLITSNETYLHYQKSVLAQQEQKRLAEEQARREAERSKSTDPRVQEVLDRGNAFIAEIRRCNNAIPGEEISQKITRMELIVQRIFERAEAHPEIVPELKKLMDYYLPMTVKLLNAYAEMERLPTQGETVRASKREIEATLDTLNLAFEKLLDSVFKDTAMDLSSDISVLQTLLAQEGLTEDEFSKLRKTEF